MKIQKLDTPTDVEYVLISGVVAVYFDTYESSRAGDMLAFRLYRKGEFVALISHGHGEEFGKAWRAMS